MEVSVDERLPAIGSLEVSVDELLPAIGSLVKASGSLNPADLVFLRTTDQAINSSVQAQTDKLINLANNLLSYVDINLKLQISDPIDFVDNFNALTDWTSNLLEKTDTILDNLKGRGKDYISKHLKDQNPTLIELAPANSSKTNTTSTKNFLYFHNLRRPQLEFDDLVDNSNLPFKRKIIYKPNKMRDLDFGLEGSSDITSDMAMHLKTLGITSSNASLYSLPHPYEFEIENIEYPAFLLIDKPEILYSSFEETPFTFIDTLDQLKDLTKLLLHVTEIAVDLEHHDYRSFQGFTCLIQISTRTQDYIIDALKLRSNLHLLNESFTNPKIVKVLHGAKMDVQWLQKDFGVYIVNLFDTYFASHLLELESHGLQHLLRFYCGVKVDKKYQLADWRVRPIPQEMMDYARSDTHYLLFIFDRMRNDLLRNSNPTTHNLLMQTLHNSEQVSLLQYEKAIYDAETGLGNGGWKLALQKSGVYFNNEQQAVFKALHQWRDMKGREEDESLRYVLPNHMLFSICAAVPGDSHGVLACCHPVPNLIKKDVDDVVALIQNTLFDVRQLGEKRRLEIEKLEKEMAEVEKKQIDKGPVHTKFDSSSMDLDPSPPTLTTSKRKIKIKLNIIIKQSPSLIHFESKINPTNDKSESFLKSIEVRNAMVLVPPSAKNLLLEASSRLESSGEVGGGGGRQKEKVDKKGKSKVIVVADLKEKEKGNGSKGLKKRKSDVVDDNVIVIEDDDEVVFVESSKKKTKKNHDSVKPFNYDDAKGSFQSSGSSSLKANYYNPVIEDEVRDKNQSKLGKKKKSDNNFMKPN